jgi:hypothetical protein
LNTALAAENQPPFKLVDLMPSHDKSFVFQMYKPALVSGRAEDKTNFAMDKQPFFKIFSTVVYNTEDPTVFGPIVSSIMSIL